MVLYMVLEIIIDTCISCRKMSHQLYINSPLACLVSPSGVGQTVVLTVTCSKLNGLSLRSVDLTLLKKQTNINLQIEHDTWDALEFPDMKCLGHLSANSSINAHIRCPMN